MENTKRIDAWKDEFFATVIHADEAINIYIDYFMGRWNALSILFGYVSGNKEVIGRYGTGSSGIIQLEVKNRGDDIEKRGRFVKLELPVYLNKHNK